MKSMGSHGQSHMHHHHMLRDFKRRFIFSTVLTAPVLALSPSIQSWFGYRLSFPGANHALALISALIYIYGGWPFLAGMAKELRKRLPGMMTLISLAISVAFVYSLSISLGLPGKTFYWELATLIDIMLLGHYIEMKSVMGASAALEALARMLPSKAHLIKGDELVDVPLDKLNKGDLVLVRPGERVPLDGVVVEGETSVDESMLTGESRPVYKGPGSRVIGGSINIDGSIKVKVEKLGKETYIMQVMSLVKRAQESRSKTQDLADRAAFVLTVIAIGVGLITLLSWIYLGESTVFALERMVTVMVVTCPHALGLAIPLVVAVSTSMLATHGILIRNRDAFERLRNVDVVVFDKTGTLTEGRFEVTGVIPLGRMDWRDVLRYAASLEAYSEHPIARGIVAKAKELGLGLLDATNFRAMPGRGVRGIIDGREVLAVSPGFVEEKGLDVQDPRVKDALDGGESVIFIIVDGSVEGAVTLSDKIREESFEAVRMLKRMGLKVYMITGDNARVARRVSKALGIDEFFAEILPHQKAVIVSKLRGDGHRVAMVGDGVNDAPALVQADVGVAIGAGTDVAIESADLILVRNDPRDVVFAVSVARSAYRKMLENLFWATGYNALTIPLAAGILYGFGFILSPALGAVLMSLSTVIVAINAKLLR